MGEKKPKQNQKSNQKNPHEQGITSAYPGSRLQHDPRLSERHPGHTAGWRLRALPPAQPFPPRGPPVRTKPAGSAALPRRYAPQAERARGPAAAGQHRRRAGEGNAAARPAFSGPPSAPATAPPPPRRTHLLLALARRSPPPPPPPPGAERVGGGEGGVRPPGPERGAARAGGGGARGAARAPADPPLPPRAPGQPSWERRRRHRLRTPFPAALAPPAPPPMMTTMTAAVTSQLGGRWREGRKRRRRHLGEGGVGARLRLAGVAMGRAEALDREFCGEWVAELRVFNLEGAWG